MLGGMGMGMGDKTVRELFVGNTPQGTSDFVLLEFLNAAMKQVRLLFVLVCFFVLGLFSFSLSALELVNYFFLVFWAEIAFEIVEIGWFFGSGEKAK